MTKIETLEQEVRALSHDELSEFRAWFARYDAAKWDRQIESDVKAGKLDRLAAEALAAHRRGESREF
ncbi:MAG: hypothetical protein GY719_14980 [bacterium]|nr:hypothetical protein [bacterium]